MKVVHLAPAIITGKINGNKITVSKLSLPNRPDIVDKVTPTEQKPTVPNDKTAINLRTANPETWSKASEKSKANGVIINWTPVSHMTLLTTLAR